MNKNMPTALQESDSARVQESGVSACDYCVSHNKGGQATLLYIARLWLAVSHGADKFGKDHYPPATRLGRRGTTGKLEHFQTANWHTI